MPQAAIAAITPFLVGLGASAATAHFLATVFVYAASSYLLNRAAQALAPRARSAGLGTGTEINYYDSAASVRIVYGRVKTGGMETIPPYTSGVANSLLHKVLTLAGHQIDSYQYAHFDTTTITNSAIGPISLTNSDGMVTTGTFSGHAFIRRYLGTSTDSRDEMLFRANSAAFNNFRGRGIAKAAVAFKYNDEIYRNTPTVTFTYQGKRCYDPRLDVTPGASPTNPSYIAWTQNPALCLADYLLSDLGGGYASEDIDWTTAVTAANYCDGAVNIPGGTQARYACNGVLFTTDEFIDNVKALVDSMLGRVTFRDGQWRMHAGSWKTPDFSIQKSDWISGLSIRFEHGKAKRFNQMRVRYVDPEREWQLSECLPRTNSTYRTADGEELLDAETEQLLCTSEYEAQRKGEFLLRQSRNQITVAGRLPPRFQNIALWDTGTIVFDHLGWSSKTFRCVGADLYPDGSMDCVFVEEQSGDWTDPTAGEYNSPSTSPLPVTNVTTPTEPPSFSVTQQVNGTLLFAWTTPIVKPAGTVFQIIRSTNASDASVGTVVWQGDANQISLVMPTSPHWYYIRGFANGVYSPYTPNTSGMYAVSRIEADNTLGSRIVPDGEFSFGASASYWWTQSSILQPIVTGSHYVATSAQLGGYYNLSTNTLDFGYLISRSSITNAASYGLPLPSGVRVIEVIGRVRVNSRGSASNTVIMGVDIYGQFPGAAPRSIADGSIGFGVQAVSLGLWHDFSGRFGIDPSIRVNSGEVGYLRPIVLIPGSINIDIARFEMRDVGWENAPARTLEMDGPHGQLRVVDTTNLMTITTSDVVWSVNYENSWPRLPLGYKWFVSKATATQSPVYIRPASGTTLYQAGTAAVGTVTIAATQFSSFTITRIGQTIFEVAAA
jgi:hypothetical protein